MPRRSPNEVYLINFYRARMGEKKVPMKLRFEAAEKFAQLVQGGLPAANTTPQDDSIEKTLEQMRRGNDGLSNGKSSGS